MSAQARSVLEVGDEKWNDSGSKHLPNETSYMPGQCICRSLDPDTHFFQHLPGPLHRLTSELNSSPAIHPISAAACIHSQGCPEASVIEIYWASGG